MQKKVTIITIVIVAIVFVGTLVGIYLAVSSGNSKKLSEITTKTEKAQSDLDSLKARKDANGFTPEDVVKSFFTEVKGGSVESAKLYLAPEAQGMDISATLKLGSDLANISTGENIEEADGSDVRVSMTFIMATDDTTVRIFELSKYDDVWKIVGVSAE